MIRWRGADYLTARELAEVLGKTPGHVRRLINRGVFATVEIGGVRYVPGAELDTRLARQVRAGQPPLSEAKAARRAREADEWLRAHGA